MTGISQLMSVYDDIHVSTGGGGGVGAASSDYL